MQKPAPARVKAGRKADMTNKYVFAVKVFRGYKKGWQIAKIFPTMAAADAWMAETVRANGYYYGDFRISRVLDARDEE